MCQIDGTFRVSRLRLHPARVLAALLLKPIVKFDLLVFGLGEEFFLRCFVRHDSFLHSVEVLPH